MSREVYAKNALPPESLRSEFSLSYVVENALKEKTERFRAEPLKNYIEKIDNNAIIPPRSVYDFLYNSVSKEKEEKFGFPEYPSFRQGRYAVMGQKRAIEEIVQYFAKGKETGGMDTMLMIIGPTGSGKSTLVESIKEQLILSIETGEIKTLPSEVAGCRAHDDPVLFVGEIAGVKAKEKIGEHLHIHGEVCPDCARLIADAKSEGRIEEFFTDSKVQILNYSANSGLGVGVLRPEMTDPFTEEGEKQLADVIIGANRGILEIPEFGRHSRSFLNRLPDLIRGRKLAVKGREYHLDMVIVGHMTLEEWVDFCAHKENASLIERMEVVRIGYNLSLSDEVNMYEKILREESNFSFSRTHQEDDTTHISQKAFETLGQFAIRTRLAEPNTTKFPKLTPSQKIQMHNGQKVEGYTEQEVKEIIESEKEREGLTLGVSHAFMKEQLFSFLTQNRECLDPVQILLLLNQSLKNNTVIDSTKKRRYVEKILPELRDYVDVWVGQTIRKAFRSGFEDAIETEFQNYMLNLELWQSKGTIYNKLLERDESADLAYLKFIEDSGNTGKTMSVSEREQMRGSILMTVKSLENIEEIPDAIKRGIEIKIMGMGEADMIELIKLAAKRPLTSLEKDKQEKINRIIGSLISDHSMCKCCAPKIVQYAGLHADEIFNRKPGVK